MITVNNPTHPDLPNEKSVTVDSERGNRVNIHPWLDGINNRSESAVSLTFGTAESLPRDGLPIIEIVDRSEFVEAILAVFPELARA